MKPEQNMNRLGELSAAKRQEKARIKRDVKTGALTVGELIARPPAVILDVPLVDLVRWKDKFGTSKLNGLGKRALVKGVNLMVPVGKASARSRFWLASELGEGRSYYQALRLLDEEEREMAA